MPRRRFVWLTKAIRAKISECGQYFTWFEVSLPRLLFGHNGRLIENQLQLNEALEKLHQEAERWAEGVAGYESWQPWRMDLVWNFDQVALPILMAHAGLRVPGINKGATIWEGGYNLTWSGAKSRFEVTIYDKSRAMHVCGSVLRAEIRLCGEQLMRRLRGKVWHDWDSLYCIYRQVMSSIPPVEKPIAANGWAEAVGGESPETRRRILSRLAHGSQRTFRERRRRVEQAAAKLSDTFSWAKILPVAGPPAPVHVEPTRRQSPQR